MTFLPVVERELRVAARRKATHWTRFFAALVVIAISFVLLLGARRVSTPQLGQMLFMATSVLGFGFSLLAGIFLTADCLCSERREGTLGLLFLTDLRGFDVVLGKLVANSVTAVYALLAIVPMLALPLIMGGVTLGEFVRMAIVLAVTLALSLAAGMLASALCNETRSAMLVSFAIMAALTGGIAVVWFVCEELLRMRRMEVLFVPSPLGAFLFSRAAVFGFSKITTYYWTSIGWMAGLAGCMLAFACWALPRLWQQRQVVSSPGRARAAARQSALRRWTDTVGATNPYRWLATRERFPRLLARGFFVLVTLVWLVFFFLSAAGRRGDREECFVTCFLMAFGLHLIVKGLIAMQASRRFCEDRRSGALELLLISPIEPGTILDGQWAALRRQFGWLLGVLVMMNVLMVFVLTSGSFRMPANAIATFSLILLGGAALLLVDFIALGWVGMRSALDGRRHHRTVMTTLGRIMLGPWVGVFIFVMLGFSGGIDEDYIALLFLIWAGLSSFLSLGLALRARQALTYDMRRLASGDVPRRSSAALQSVRIVQSKGPKYA